MEALPAQAIAATPAAKLLASRFVSCAPLRVFSVPREERPRLSIVTDSINAGSLYGGVGTALLLGALLARQQGARLRIVTLTEAAHTRNLHDLLAVHGVDMLHEVEFAFAPATQQRIDLDVQPGEMFLTTSWWTTASTMAVVPNEAIVYLLQEDERMFYRFDDERLRCSQVLSSADIRFVVNTELLFEHFRSEGFTGIASNGCFFEPAFPAATYHPRKRLAGERPVLLFYARPNHARNLFYLGLEVLDQAVRRQLVDVDHWRIVFVGRDIPRVALGDEGFEPEVLEGLSWSDYAALVGSVDVGLCLMYTPHPSYPPLDLAASGAVAVTNRYGGKRALDAYSENIVCADLEVEALLTALGEGIALSQRRDERRHNFEQSKLHRDWQEAFAPVLAQLEA